MKKLLGLLLLTVSLFGLSTADTTKPIGLLKMSDMPEPMYWPFKPDLPEFTLWCFGQQTLVLFDDVNETLWPLNDIAHKRAKELVLEPSLTPILWSQKKETQEMLLKPIIDMGLKYCQ